MNITPAQYEQKVSIADRAAADITQYLKSKGWTIINVEDNPTYIEKDIDLIAIRSAGPKKFPEVFYIEIKGDLYHKTGNYFIETISNTTKNTPGCFLYTKSDYIFYYFVETKELHIMPTKESQQWFLNNIHRFNKKLNPQTRSRYSNKILYESEGHLVPRKIMNQEVDIQIRQL